MSLDGRTLKVDSYGGQPENFRTHIYVRPNGTWLPSVVLSPLFSGDTCEATRMSGDGNTLVSACESMITHDASWRRASAVATPGLTYRIRR